MRFGRVLDIGDELFAARCTFPTPASVALSRQSSDDYVRFRLPDTNCPRLPLPNVPLDSGISDDAEPARWNYTGNPQYLGDGWQFGPERDYALNMVEPSYLCYPGDFETEVTLSWSSDPPAGLNPQHGGLAADFDSFLFGLPDYNSWIELGAYGESDTGTNLWWLWVSPISNGVRGSLLGTLVEGQEATFRIRRVGSAVYVQYGTNAAQVASGVNGMVRLRLERNYTINGEFGLHIPRVTVTRWRTISGAPELIWVETPVVDVGLPVALKVRAYPRGVHLVWRAGDSLPLPPYWDNPTGAYRYWQARLATTNWGVLLERIEFVPVRQDVLFEIPCAMRAIYVHHAQGIFSRGNAKGIVSIHRTPTDEGYEISSERLLTVDW